MPRKVSKCHWELAQIIQKAADIIDIHDIEYEIQYGCDDIDSFSTCAYVVYIRGKRNGQKIRKDILIKWHVDQKQRACYRELYRRDYIFHKIVAPRLLKIQNDMKIIEGLKMSIPNCIYSSIDENEEVMVFANLQNGHTLHNRSLKVNLDHATLVLKNLAKLHALSFVWKILYPEEFEEVETVLRKDAQYSHLDRIQKSVKYYFYASVDAVSNPEYKEKLKDLAPHLLTILKSVAPAQYSTICHGDCWSNNISFKYLGSRPIEAMFVDYQLSRCTSPVADISYFLYMSTEGNLLFEYHEHLLRVYYGTLTAVLRQCNLNPEDVYSAETFDQQLRVYSVLGLIEALISMKIITADCEDAMKMAEMKYNQPDVCLYDYKSTNQNTFIERVNMIVNSFFLHNYSLTEIMHKTYK